MKKLSSILWGIVLIAIGVVFGLNAFNITDIDVLFDGWWTLFIIVPCTIGLFTDNDKMGSIVGILIGVFLLLCCQDILSFDMLWKLAIPAVIILIGIKMIVSNIFGNTSAEVLTRHKENGTELKKGTAVFSGHDMNFNGQVFDGAELNAVFGGVKCDLTNAIFGKDSVINASAIFGGIEIYVPENINVKINSNSIFGGVSDKKHRNYTENSFTLYINATCIFGGVEIK